MSLITTLGAEPIRTSFEHKPVPNRKFDWSATFDSYDGAPDAGFQPIGYGPTEVAAVVDLLQQASEE